MAGVAWSSRSSMPFLSKGPVRSFISTSLVNFAIFCLTHWITLDLDFVFYVGFGVLAHCYILIWLLYKIFLTLFIYLLLQCCAPIGSLPRSKVHERVMDGQKDLLTLYLPIQVTDLGLIGPVTKCDIINNPHLQHLHWSSHWKCV